MVANSGSESSATHWPADWSTMYCICNWSISQDPWAKMYVVIPLRGIVAVR